MKSGKMYFKVATSHKIKDLSTHVPKIEHFEEQNAFGASWRLVKNEKTSTLCFYQEFPKTNPLSKKSVKMYFKIAVSYKFKDLSTHVPKTEHLKNRELLGVLPRTKVSLFFGNTGQESHEEFGYIPAVWGARLRLIQNGGETGPHTTVTP